MSMLVTFSVQSMALLHCNSSVW